jgi:hypothetical protein
MVAPLCLKEIKYNSSSSIMGLKETFRYATQFDRTHQASQFPELHR